MASEKQIAASRANARRSTGPRTALGKLKASRNAFRHGLSIPLQSNHAGSEEIHALVKALVEGDTSEVKLLAANNVALVQLEHARIRKTRAVFFNDINVGVDDAQNLKRLAALDRYERIANAKRRKAAKTLLAERGREPNFSRPARRCRAPVLDAPNWSSGATLQPTRRSPMPP